MPHAVIGRSEANSLRFELREKRDISDLELRVLQRSWNGNHTEVDGLMGAREACGVVGAYSTKGVDVVPKLLKGLEALQHRGQESWGIAVNGKPVFKKMGLAFNWYNYAQELIGYKGGAGIGHVRYSTKGRSNLDNAQPVQIGTEFSIAHNGTIVNAEELAKAVSADYKGKCGTDTKAAGYRLLQILREGERLVLGLRAPRQGADRGLLVHDTQQAGRGLRGQGPAGLQAPLPRLAPEESHLHRRVRELRALRRRRRVRPGHRAGGDGPPGRTEEGAGVVQVRAAHRERLLLVRVHLLRPPVVPDQRRERLRGEEEGREGYSPRSRR